MSVLGVAIGVAALVVVLGVYNGFTTDIRDKILGANAHIIVSGPLAALTAPPSDADFEKMRGGEAPELSGMAAVLRRINATPGVVGSTPSSTRKACCPPREASKASSCGVSTPRPRRTS